MSIVNRIKDTFKTHVELQKDRLTILEHIWEKEEVAIMTKIINKNSKKYEKNQKLIAAIKETPQESKNAVREKWLTYCKTQFIN